ATSHGPRSAPALGVPRGQAFPRRATKQRRGAKAVCPGISSSAGQTTDGGRRDDRGARKIKRRTPRSGRRGSTVPYLLLAHARTAPRAEQCLATGGRTRHG